VLHELFTGIPVPVAYVSGPGLIFEYANDAYRQLVGREDLIGRPVREALPELAAQGRAELVTAVLESGRPFQGYENELLIRRGGASAPEQVFVECLTSRCAAWTGRRRGCCCC
jgi:PAS domain-containing protein